MDWFNKLFKSVKLLLISDLSFLYSQNENQILHSIGRFVNLTVLLIIFLSLNELSAEGDRNTKSQTLRKINGLPSRTHFNINNISTWIYNNGDADISPTGNSGFEYPKGSGKTAVFESGFLFGGIVNGEVRVGGSTYNQGLLPGRIDENGVREDTSLAHVRIYRVRPDWEIGDLSAEIIDEEGTQQEIRDQYEKDWNEWPAIHGAPYNDIDENGIYDPLVDVPGVTDADQTLWYVANDLDPATSRSLYGSDPMGMEIQVTVWGYNTNNVYRPLDNTLFKKYKLINKSVNDFDSMYVAMWADPDLGQAGDDYVGCDPDLSLMYCYNGDSEDAQYGKSVPSFGFDMIQGPTVLGHFRDKAIFNGEIIEGFKNLEIVSHFFFVGGDPVYSDPNLSDYRYGTFSMWNIFRGRIPYTGEPFVDPATGQITKYTLDGDPVAKTGWLDGLLHPPGDRRQIMSSGPFIMEPGDTQEVVFAEIIAGGVDNVDRLQAINLLKSYSAEIQSKYLNLFKQPPALKQPEVTVGSFDQEILLNWSSNQETINYIELFDTLNFSFQGYAVYQFPHAQSPISDAIQIATFDIIDGVEKVVVSKFDTEEGIITNSVKFRGTDSGIERSVVIKSDTLNSGRALYNGSEYYFGVSAYTVSSDPFSKPIFIESPIKIIEAIPHTPNPGEMFTGNRGDTLSIEHITGEAKVVMKIKVVDPTLLTGQTYTMFFHTDTSSITPGRTLWGLKDPTGTVLYDNYILFVADKKGLVGPPVIDGLEIQVEGADAGILDWSYEGNRWVSGVNWGGQELFGGMDNGFDFFGSEITKGTDFMNVQLRWAGVNDFDGTADKSASALAATSQTEYPEFWSKGQSYRRDLGYPASGAADIPFSAYDIEADPPRRLNICIVEDVNNGSANLLWDMGWDGNAFATNGGREYIFIMNSDYNEGADYDDTNWGPAADVLYAIWPTSRGSRSYLLDPFTLDIIAANPYSEEDTFVFVSPESGYSLEKAKEDVKKINVFPNPYYGTDLSEFGRTEHYVTFNHLPNKAIIRIYNLAGHRIRKISKDDESQFLKWNLMNENNFQIANGMYIVYIDLPDLRETKIIKLAVITEQLYQGGF